MSVTTPKARRLGAALREARTASGMGTRQLAQLVHKDHSLISRYESGERVPKPEDIATILATLGVQGARRDEILNLARGHDQPRWLAVTLPEQRQQLAAVLDSERSATSIITVSPLLVPGLLQTTPYIRAIMTAGGVPADEIETRIAVRIGRRETISGDSPTPFSALIGEAALRQEVGGPAVITDQLRHLKSMAERPSVDLRIIPFTVTWHPALEGPFVMYESAERARSVHLENRRSGMFLHEAEDTDLYRDAIEAIHRAALDPADSVALIDQIMYEKGTTS